MPGRTTRLLLIRHGQSEWNEIRRWQGRADTPLTALGRSQAAIAAEQLATLPRFGAVWASPLGRASETAEIIADRLGLAPVQLDDRLVEADAGEWQGRTPDEIERAYPGFLASHRRPDTFESFESVVERVDAAVRDIALTAEDVPLLAVAHSGVIRSLVRHLGEPDQRIPNLGGRWLAVPADPSARIELGARFHPDAGPTAATDRRTDDLGEAPARPS